MRMFHGKQENKDAVLAVLDEVCQGGFVKMSREPAHRNRVYAPTTVLAHDMQQLTECKLHGNVWAALWKRGLTPWTATMVQAVHRYLPEGDGNAWVLEFVQKASVEVSQNRARATVTLFALEHQINSKYADVPSYEEALDFHERVGERAVYDLIDEWELNQKLWVNHPMAHSSLTGMDAMMLRLNQMYRAEATAGERPNPGKSEAYAQERTKKLAQKILEIYAG